jgi:hypothetical protein
LLLLLLLLSPPLLQLHLPSHHPPLILPPFRIYGA